VHAASPALRTLLDAQLLRQLSVHSPSVTVPDNGPSRDGQLTVMGRQEVVEVVAGLIRDERGRYLITRRRQGTHLEGLWEFPGGKREPDESLAQSLQRELHEELGGRFAVGELVETVRWTYPEKTVVLSFFHCRLEEGAIEPREGQLMQWVAAADLQRYDFPPADATLLARLTSQA
jgi:8-oxo-dGTP diphosphatase